MLRNLFTLALPFLAFSSVAQNPSTVVGISQRNIFIPCGSTCTAITAKVPNIRQSDEYVVQPITYRPFDYVANGTELTSFYKTQTNDNDIYSSIINLPFPVCFYGVNYNRLVVGANGIVSFDVTNADKRNSFAQTPSLFNSTPIPIPYEGGRQNSFPSVPYYPKAAIMGVFHDITPERKGDCKVEWRMEGTAPQRRFIASFNEVPLFSCDNQTATHQIVLYESTGVVEVYVRDKPVCAEWNSGLAILGMQDFTRKKAVFPEGRNSSKWGSVGMNEAYRFTPAAGLSRFKKAELISNGTVVALADTTSDNDGNLNLNFANVCQAEDSVQYLLRVTYNSCAGATAEISFEDSLTIKKEKLEVSLQTQNPTCTSGGTITVNATGTSPSFLYSLDGGPAQTSNVFSNVPKGSHTVTVSSATCTKTASTTLTLQDDLALTAQPQATICAGETFTPQIASNGSSFSWSPSTGVSNSSEASPQITGQSSVAYTITATRGVCEKKAVMNVTVKPLPTVNAGDDQTIVQGDVVQLTTTASAGTYQWTPSNGLNSATVQSPSAMPAQTTTYRLTVTNEGCTAFDEVTINVAPYCVKPMEAFSPNGDGINDLWFVTTGNCLQRAKVEVFNRYGGKVYHSEDYKNNWSGTYEGKPLADGTYYFIITYQLINGKTVYHKGNVTILR